ncbi:hypothetical protein Hanom_Chr17g01575841 [Helianthus anomalus]
MLKDVLPLEDRKCNWKNMILFLNLASSQQPPSSSSSTSSSMATTSLWNSTTSGRSNVVCSCGAASCIRTSCREANLGRRFLCCTDGCGLLRWIDPPISCPRCERLLPSLLSTNRENVELKLLKAKEVAEKGGEVQRLKFLLCFSWLVFVLCVLIW